MKQSSPKISIITVTFNAGKTLEETIKSVIAQKKGIYEYIIIDGKSNDNTVDIIKKYAQYITYWISEPDNGIYNAMNKGINASQGDYIYFLGADDILLPGILEQIYIYLCDNSIYYGNVIMKHKKNIYDGKFNSFKLVIKNIPHQAMFYPKTILQKELFNENYKLLADYYLNLCLWNKIKFIYIPKTIAIYNDEGSSSINKDIKFEKNRLYILSKNLPWYCFPYILYRKFRTFIRHLIND